MFALCDALTAVRPGKSTFGSMPSSCSPHPLEEASLETSCYEECHCSHTAALLRTLHIEGLSANITAVQVSERMSQYGAVQYAEAAPEVIKDAQGVPIGRRVHCYVVFTDHASACAAKRALQPKGGGGGGGGDAPTAPPDQAPQVRFAKPQSLASSCTPAFRSFVAAQWSHIAALTKGPGGVGGAGAGVEFSKPACRVNALFISKLHQHITNARLNAVMGKFGPMIACEVQYHSDGRSAGHGVVIFETIEDAERALAATNGQRLEGRAIEVTPLRLKKLPSKLEHLKNRIKRQPIPGGGDLSSDDGSCAGPLPSPPGAGPVPPPPMLPSAAAAAAAAAHHAAALQQLILAQGGFAPTAAAALGMAPYPGAMGLSGHLELVQHLLAQQVHMQAQMMATGGGGAPPMAPLGAAPLAGMPPGSTVLPGGVVLAHHAAGGALPPGLDLSFL